MNNPGSVLYGWGILIVAGAGSYYFAKKSIDERRRTQERKGTRPKEQMTWQERIAQSEKDAASAVSSGVAHLSQPEGKPS